MSELHGLWWYCQFLSEILSPLSQTVFRSFLSSSKALPGRYTKLWLRLWVSFPFSSDVKHIFSGRASFKDAISFTSRGRIQSSHFMTFHKKLSVSNSTDFIVAMERARMVARRLERAIDDTAHVFAYSKIFPFYEQYSTILPILTTQLLITVVGVFGIICITLGIDVKGAACAVICQISNYFHIVAFMYLFDIPVNALSATNLVMVRHKLDKMLHHTYFSVIRYSNRVFCKRVERLCLLTPTTRQRPSGVISG